MPKALSMALRSLKGTRIEQSLADPAAQVKKGSTVADALHGAADTLPPFVLPAIRAGEETGRLEESLRFLQRHCEMLAGPAKAIRNAWLYPLVILLVGSVACTFVCLVLGSPKEAFQFLVGETFGWGKFAIVVGICFVPALKKWIDRARLHIPLLNSIERDMANHCFFRILGLMYGCSNAPVDRMITIAASSISNLAAREELNKAAEAIRNKETVSESFSHPDLLLDQDQKTSIAGGELAGKLEETFTRIADATEESLKRKLKLVERVSSRDGLGRYGNLFSCR